MADLISEEVDTFVSACETLLEATMVRKLFTEFEIRAIQYYLSALSAKFPTAQ